MSRQNLLVTVSGGRSSAMMARHIQMSHKYKDYNKLYVFCNTGQERHETIDFLKDIVKYWKIPLNIIEGVYSLEHGVGVKSKIVDFDTMDMQSMVFSEAIAHVNKNKWIGVPNSATPYCSEYLKIRPSHHFAKKIFGTTKYVKALGYRREDMPKRITLAELKHDATRIAPLLTDFDRPIGHRELNHFYDNNEFKLRIHSDLGNCEMCYKKSTKNLIKSIQTGATHIDWYRDKQNQYGDLFFRENMSIDDLVKLAENSTQLDMFENVGDGCVCNF
ncbi:phosphoadenosine phosphosulfate reductase [Flavobacterium sp. CAU 1735]|uniref:phosphoadenosine phosphosulfate reductase n=1 Tax=Flavobacterium sp. CAU 1735 TaxID=3140361 RepID=UPI0032619078